MVREIQHLVIGVVFDAGLFRPTRIVAIVRARHLSKPLGSLTI